MPEYAYTKVPGKLKELLGKIRDLGNPKTVTTVWLASAGFKSTNDRSLIGVLRQIGFIDDSHKPKESWYEYKKSGYKQVLAQGIIEGYSDLFSMYSDANQQTNEVLEDFFVTKTKSGKQVTSAMVSTFRALSELADFSLIATPSMKINSDQSLSQESTDFSRNKNFSNSDTPSFSPKLHIDIQIHISSDSTAKQIDNIFESMAKHIFRIKE